MSSATASRALRGMKVHKKFQGKAEAAAAELGYVLNEQARALRSERTMTVGMVYFELTSLLGTELLGAITAGLDEIGYSLFVSTAQGQPDRYDQLVARFLQRRVDALVCVHARGTGTALGGYAAAGAPVLALITQAGGYAGLPRVGPSIAEASAQCLARLKDLGHGRITVLAPDRRSPLIDGFVSVAKEHQAPVLRCEFAEDAFDPRALLAELQSRKALPTVIVTLQAEAAALVGAAEALGISIPRDLSIISIRDRSIPPAALRPSLATLHINPAPMGQAAAAILNAWLSQGVALDGFRPVEVGEWLERDSLGPARI